jgi:hypothetical protein
MLTHTFIQIWCNKECLRKWHSSPAFSVHSLPVSSSRLCAAGSCLPFI